MSILAYSPISAPLLWHLLEAWDGALVSTLSEDYKKEPVVDHTALLAAPLATVSVGKFGTKPTLAAGILIQS